MGFNNFSLTEPINLIYPFLSKRKLPHYDQNINKGTALNVLNNLYNLPARIDLLTSSNYPHKDELDLDNYISHYDIMFSYYGS
jgi:hypothetical protein